MSTPFTALDVAKLVKMAGISVALQALGLMAFAACGTGLFISLLGWPVFWATGTTLGAGAYVGGFFLGRKTESMDAAMSESIDEKAKATIEQWTQWTTKRGL